MSFLVSEELSFRIPVELRYDARDPYAVRLTFHLPGDAPVTWAFGRELLLDGINKPCGDGDVHIAPTHPEDLSDVHIRLQVGGDQALFRASAAPLVAFLDRTDRIVPSDRSATSGTSRRTSTRPSARSSPNRSRTSRTLADQLTG